MDEKVLIFWGFSEKSGLARKRGVGEGVEGREGSYSNAHYGVLQPSPLPLADKWFKTALYFIKTGKQLRGSH